MRRLLLFVIVLAFPMLMLAQSVNEIKNSKEYLWGEGWGDTYKKANQQALQAVVEQISMSIESEFTHIEDEVIAEGDIDYHSAVRSVMKTYSQVTLDSTMTIVISQEPKAHVLRYVKASEKDKFFENRKAKVNDFVKLAQIAEKKGNIDVALMNYYWAYCLLTSLPNSTRIPSPDAGIAMKQWIPNQMNEIFSNIKVQKQNVDGEFVTLRITYKGAPVSRLDYTYFDGRGQTNIHTAVDGIGNKRLGAAKIAREELAHRKYHVPAQPHQRNAARRHPEQRGLDNSIDYACRLPWEFRAALLHDYACIPALLPLLRENRTYRDALARGLR